MRKALETATLTSCLNRSRDDEPLFVLCGRDSSAPGAVRQWAAAYRRKHQAAGTFDSRRKYKYYEAQTAANDMVAWAKAHT